MSLRDIADRIANTTSVWEGPEEDREGWLIWRASQRVDGEPQDAGLMALNETGQEERLVIVDFHDVEFEETLSAPSQWFERIEPDETAYNLTTSRFRKGVPSPTLDDSFDPSPRVSGDDLRQ
jgi:hypothetical protein